MEAIATSRRRTDSSEKWWHGETAVSLMDAPAALPPRPGGKPPSVATLRRWVRAGVHGLRLRVFAGGPRSVCTTHEELRRFVSALSALRGLDG